MTGSNISPTRDEFEHGDDSSHSHHIRSLESDLNTLLACTLAILPSGFVVSPATIPILIKGSLLNELTNKQVHH
jgi:hypothetical protein